MVARAGVLDWRAVIGAQRVGTLANAPLSVKRKIAEKEIFPENPLPERVFLEGQRGAGLW